MEFRNMKKWTLIITVLFFTQLSFSQEKESQSIAGFFKVGSVSGISSYFPSSLDMTILETEDVFSNAQATQIITQFFKTNKPSDFIVNHKGSSKGGDYYQIGTLKTNNGTYRVTYFLKKDQDKVFIKRLKIEQDEDDF